MRYRTLLVPALFIALLSAAALGQEPGAPRSLQVTPIAADQGEGGRWAVVIGVGRYRHVSTPLEFAAADAREFAEALVTHCGFRREQIRTLVDEEATASGIRTAIGTWLPQVAQRPDDLAVIYFSGHGAPDEDRSVAEDGIRKYLVGHDADPGNLFGTAVPLDELSAALLRLRSERVLVLLDCCYSGAGLPAGAAGQVRTLQRPGVRVAGRLKDGYVGSLAGSGRGRAVIAACAPNELAWEYRDLRHGAFTHSLLQALAGKAADLEGRVTGASLYTYVCREVERIGRGRGSQTPMMSSSLAGGDLLLAGRGVVRPGEGAVGRLKVLTSPLGADVFLDREPAPIRSPFERELPAGPHRLSIYKPGYLPASEEVYVTPDRLVVRSYVLRVEENRGDLLVLTSVAARVQVDGHPVGQAGPESLLRVPELEARAHPVRVEAEGFDPEERMVAVAAGPPSIARFELRRTLAGRRAPMPADFPPGLRSDGDRFEWGKDNVEMVFVSEGKFRMGRDAQDDARPEHEVDVSAFWIDRHEVTNARYARFVREMGYQPRGEWRPVPGREAHPAVSVTLEDARAYASWAGKVLPTEAQWEKAARGTDGRLFPYGSTMTVGYQNIRAFGLGDTTEVARLAEGASPYGALDMLGNVWEWTVTPYGAYPGNTALVARTGVLVVRGGSYLTHREGLFVTTRSYLQPNIGQKDVGFRCVVPVK